MFKYVVSFLLVNSYYQSLGIPIQQNLSISESLLDLTKKCGNPFLSNAIKSKIKDCEISIVSPTVYNTKQIRCLIFYDINKQLCSSVAASKLSLADDFKSKIVEKEDVNTVCTLAKDWIFTDLTEYANYKNSSEYLMKSPATCGEICGVEDAVNDVNSICKYYKWGIDIINKQVLKSPISTENNVNNNNIEPPAVPETDLNARPDIAVPINANALSPQMSNANAENEKTKQTQSAAPKAAANNQAEVGTVPKSTVQTSKQPSVSNSDPNIGKSADEHLDVQKPVIDMPAVATNDQAMKPVVNSAPKPDIQNDPLLPNNDLLDQNDVLTNNDGNASNDAYSEDIDGDDEDTALNIKSPPVKQESPNRNNLPSSNGDLPQKDYFPNSDGFSDDGDHFFPFFLSGVIMVVLLYVLYHNKNKVSKVFFGLVLEGRQSNRRRNSRGHAYRRLDTLEQAMSANTAAPPSKIIY